ncbi:MAG: GyrI-like domain-containing protein [Defluviitaleaceae bacterium]|nr:GyrI-like domain-containing protein [Defluviitaleaceae bacterium]
MAAKIVNLYTETLPALRLIGKPCDCEVHDFVGDWDKWLRNGWFAQLEKLGAAPENADRYLGVTDNMGGYWIGLLFPQGAPVPDGFEFAEIPALRYAILQFEGKHDKELLGEDGINLIIEETRRRGLPPAPLWGGWCIERYSKPTPQNGTGKVLLECLYEIQ